MPKLTISDIKAANEKGGFYFFHKGAMKFFASKILPTVYQGDGGVYFVTSETCFDDSARVFKVRSFDRGTGNVHTVSRAFTDVTAARSHAKRLASVLGAVEVEAHAE